MKTETTQAAINSLVRNKAINEFRMAAALRDYFDKTPVQFQPANDIAQFALQILEQLNLYILGLDQNPKTSVNDPEKLLVAVGQVYAGEAPLKMWGAATATILGEAKNSFKVAQPGQPTTAEKLAMLTKARAVLPVAQKQIQQMILKSAAHTITTEGCFKIKTVGEILRLFAGVCEVLNKDGFETPNKPSSYIIAKNLILKVPSKQTPESNFSMDFSAFCGLRAAYRSTPWGELAFDASARCRGPQANVVLDIASAPGSNYKQDLQLEEPYIYGNTLFKLKETDVVRYIDLALGLPEGASISGTTADCVWALEGLAQMLAQRNTNFKYDPNLYLLPLAAIVAGYHHTVLEVALALGINHPDTVPLDAIKYAPGFYSTLQSATMRKAAEGGAVAAILERHEKHADNAILVISGGKDAKTAYVADKTNASELQKYKDALLLNYAAYQKWATQAKTPLVPFQDNFTPAEMRKVLPALIPS